MKLIKRLRERGTSERTIKRIFQIARKNANSRDTEFDITQEYIEGL